MIGHAVIQAAIAASVLRLADQAKELGIEIDLNYSFAQPKKTDK